MAAATTTGIFILSLFLSVSSSSSSSSSSPYLSSSTTLFKNYQNMLTTFKIFIYTTTTTPVPPLDPPASLFYNSLLHSPFITQNPIEAHLFFIPLFPDDTSSSSTRSLSRLVRHLRNNHPYWNRTLGADHFFLSPAGIDYSSDRNVLELKKNAIQVSVFPVTSGYFVPHKDITLPPFNPHLLLLREEHPHQTMSFLGYLKWDGKTQSNSVNELKGYDDEFLVEQESDPSDYVRSAKKSKFCLFLYHGDVAWMVEAMSLGCVPVVIVDGPIQDLPLMDVLRWSDVALLVRGGGLRVKEILSGVSEEKYWEMRELSVAASKHLAWNVEKEEAQPFDAFHMVMYQLWLRRHVVRYSRRRTTEFAQSMEL